MALSDNYTIIIVYDHVSIKFDVSMALQFR